MAVKSAVKPQLSQRVQHSLDFNSKGEFKNNLHKSRIYREPQKIKSNSNISRYNNDKNVTIDVMNNE